jgi:very-short-patch-repair endonuclease
MSLLDNAKTLRRNLTDAEQKLWYHLRAHRFMGRKFKRQKPMGRYVVDFICIEEKLVIELDGGQHSENVGYDHVRDSWLRSEGYTVLRFWNNELMNEMEGVLERIRLTVDCDAQPLSPSPSPTKNPSPQSSPASGRGGKREKQSSIFGRGGEI